MDSTISTSAEDPLAAQIDEEIASLRDESKQPETVYKYPANLPSIAT